MPMKHSKTDIVTVSRETMAKLHGAVFALFHTMTVLDETLKEIGVPYQNIHPACPADVAAAKRLHDGLAYWLEKACIASWEDCMKRKEAPPWN